MTKTKTIKDEINDNNPQDWPRLVAAATTPDEVGLFETFSILQIKMKDPKTGKPVFKNRKDMVWAAIELFNQTNSKYLEIIPSVTSHLSK